MKRPYSATKAEDKVNEVRASLSNRLLPVQVAPDIGQLTDSAVAAMLTTEAKLASELSASLGPRAYLVRKILLDLTIAQ
jgi:hypothetical protein